MIRRDLPADENSPARWVLIPQTEHARLAGNLAEHWGADGFAPLKPHDELLWAIAHHDDGWPDWDRAPDVDHSTGIPRSFTEMEIDDSLAIWSASIDGAARAGKLEGSLVAGHFCALARRAAAWKKDDPAWDRAEQFIARYEARIDSWLEAWQQQDRAANTTAVAELALAQLQFFDLLSLWFCCAAAAETDVVPTPAGPDLTLSPQDSGHVRLSPWPLLVAQLNLEIPGRIVPRGHYGSRDLLAAAPSQPVLLRWELRAAGAAGAKI
jgi:Protein of unknown function (DUF3891)